MRHLRTLPRKRPALHGWRSALTAAAGRLADPWAARGTEFYAAESDQRGFSPEVGGSRDRFGQVCLDGCRGRLELGHCWLRWEPWRQGRGPVPLASTPHGCWGDVRRVRNDHDNQHSGGDRDGLHLKVSDHSGLSGTYLNYRSGAADGGAPGGGDPVLVGSTDRVLLVPPGDVYLDCSYSLGTKNTAPVKVSASDPNGYYRPHTLASLGCGSKASPSWAVRPTRGKTAEAALAALVVASGQKPGLHARLAPIGYVGSGIRTYILERAGTPWATAVVSSDAGEYVAGLDVLC